jgi:hypothetical protein
VDSLGSTGDRFASPSENAGDNLGITRRDQLKGPAQGLWASCGKKSRKNLGVSPNKPPFGVSGSLDQAEETLTAGRADG